MGAARRKETRWNSRLSSAELRTGEPIELGSRFSIVNGGTPYEVTITTYDRPSRLVFEASGKPDLTIAYTFTPTAEGRDLEAFSTSAQEESEGAVPAACAGDPPGRAQAVRLAEGALRALNATTSDRYVCPVPRTLQR